MNDGLKPSQDEINEAIAAIRPLDLGQLYSALVWAAFTDPALVIEATAGVRKTSTPRDPAAELAAAVAEIKAAGSIHAWQEQARSVGSVTA